jgi:hypothetical protein
MSCQPAHRKDLGDEKMDCTAVTCFTAPPKDVFLPLVDLEGFEPSTS